MRTLPDKWNPRLWLREWLNNPSQNELKDRAAAEAEARKFFSEMEARCAGSNGTHGTGIAAEAASRSISLRAASSSTS